MNTVKNKKVMSSGLRIGLGLLVVVVVIAGSAIAVYKYRQAKLYSPTVSVRGGPDVTSDPGTGSPSSAYINTQLQSNAKKAAAAKKSFTSNVPTLVNGKYVGDVSPFMVKQNKTTSSACPLNKVTHIYRPNPANCTVENLRLARKAGVTASELRCQSCSIESLKAAGFSVGDLKDTGYTAADLKKGGYTLDQLIQAGYTAADLKSAGYSATSLHAAGLTAGQLAMAGFSKSDLDAAGFASDDVAKAIQAAKAAGVNSTLKDSCDPEQIKQAWKDGASAASLLKRGCEFSSFKKAGYPVQSLLAAGVSPSQLKSAGWSARELAKSGLSESKLKQAGFSNAEIAAVKGTIEKCSSITLSQQKKRGVPANKLLSGECSLQAFKAAGYSAKMLSDVGMNARDLRLAGYSADDLKAAGYSAADLAKAGFSAKAIRKAGFSVADERKAGIPLAETARAGYVASKLREAGITAGQLIKAGLSASELKKLGFTATELSAAGVKAGALHAAGYSAAELKQAGYSTSQLRRAGYKASQLKAAGYSLSAIKSGGYTGGDLVRAGYSAKQSGYNNSAKASVNTSTVESKANKSNKAAQGEVDPLDNYANLPSIGGVKSKKNDPLKRLEALQKVQQQQLDKSQQQALLEGMKSRMNSQASTLMTSWSNTTTQSFTKSAEVKNDVATSDSGKSGSANQGPIIKAGDVQYAVLDTSINSDENTPIMAKIVSGKLKGSKLLGSFQRVDKKIMLQFNLINIPGFDHTIPMQAVAIDPNTARTAISGSVNNHYLLRYGTTFAAAFLDGISGAIKGGTSTCSISSGTGVTDPWCQTVFQKLNTTQTALVGLGNIGNKLSSSLQKFQDTPPTVKIRGGTAFGLLFMKDLTLPKELPKTKTLTTLNDLVSKAMGNDNE